MPDLFVIADTGILLGLYHTQKGDITKIVSGFHWWAECLS